MASELQRLQSEIEGQVKDYNQLDKKVQQLTQTRNSLHEQEQENSLVLREIDILPDSNRWTTQTPEFTSRWGE